jgi:hypothetical protein
MSEFFHPTRATKPLLTLAVLPAFPMKLAIRLSTRPRSPGVSIPSQATIQQTSDPCGPAGQGGLGEPKFNINGFAFHNPWGRPQRGANSAFCNFESELKRE